MHCHEFLLNLLENVRSLVVDVAVEDQANLLNFLNENLVVSVSAVGHTMYDAHDSNSFSCLQDNGGLCGRISGWVTGNG